ncbi:MAG: ROK family protein [Phycisphaerae bacterium]
MDDEVYIGLDLGGTNIKAGVLTCVGKLLAKVSVPTGRGPTVVITNMINAAQEAVQKAGVGRNAVAAVGITSPGSLNIDTGMVLRCANLPGWENVPLRDHISEALGKPALLENDARAAAYGEFFAGAGRSLHIRSLVMITLGTGVGGGIIIDGRLVHGQQNLAGELGHWIVVPDGLLCGCGQKGCLEMYASASRVGQRAAQALQDAQVPSSLRAVMAKAGELTARDVEGHARRGDKLAWDIWNQTCHYLALACITAVHWLDPEMIVFGGGMAGAGDFLLQPVRRHFAENYWKIKPSAITIRTSQLGNDAGIIGAAMLACAMLRSHADKKGTPHAGK